MPELTVETKSAAYDAMAPKIFKVESLWGGTEAMRDAKEIFLPRYSLEQNKSYASRLKRATLFNYFKKTIISLAGKPFSKPMSTKEIPPDMEPWMDDVDLQGNDLHVFSQKLFIEAMRKGMTHVLVDFPRANAANAAEERALNLRPYLVHVKPENVFAAYTEIRNGAEVCVYARIYTSTVIRDGFGEKLSERITEYEPNHFTVWEKKRQTNSKRTIWVIVEQGDYPLDYVPLLTFYADRQDVMVSNLPLEDLADKNIEHWQSSSDQRHVLTVTRFPMLAAKGVQAKEMDDMAVGPYEILGSESPQGEFYYVEHTGAAIQAGNTDLENIKAEMAALALDMLAPRPGRLTATEKAIDASEANSVVQMMALNYEDFLERVLALMGAWKSIDATMIEVKLNTDFGLSPEQQTALVALTEAYNSRAITPKRFLSELQRRGILDPELVIDDELAAAFAEYGVKPIPGPPPPATQEPVGPGSSSAGGAKPGAGAPAK